MYIYTFIHRCIHAHIYARNSNALNLSTSEGALQQIAQAYVNEYKHVCIHICIHSHIFVCIRV